MGPSVKKSLTGLRPAQMELLENGFCEVDGVDPASLRNKGSPIKDSAAIKPISQQKKSRGGKDEGG